MAVVTALTCGACMGEGVVGGLECVECGGSGEAPAPASPLAGIKAVDAAMAAPMVDALQAAIPLDDVSTALATVSTTNTSITEHVAEARALGVKYRDVVFDVRTVKGMDEACKARASIRDHRYEIQTLQEMGSKMLGTMQRQFNARAKELIEEVKLIEAPIDEQIKAEETRKELERAEKEAAEQRRRQGHMDSIAAINRMVTDAMGLDSAQLVDKIAAAEKIIVDDGYQEFEGQAQQAKAETLRQLNGLLVQAKAEEAELEEARQAQATLRAAQAKLAEETANIAAEREAIAKERAAMDAEREAIARARAERAQAVEARIHRLQTAMMMSGSSERVAVQEELDWLRAHQPTAADYDDRAQEAADLRSNAIPMLEEALRVIGAREAEDARQQRAAEVQARIDAIAALGPKEGETADALRERIKSAEAMVFDEATYADRITEAGKVWCDVLGDLMLALAAAHKREEQEAAEAAERERERRRRAMHEARHQLMLDNASLLFSAAQALVDYIEQGGDAATLNRLTDDVRGILRRIPKETSNA